MQTKSKKSAVMIVSFLLLIITVLSFVVFANERGGDSYYQNSATDWSEQGDYQYIQAEIPILNTVSEIAYLANLEIGHESIVEIYDLHYALIQFPFGEAIALIQKASDPYFEPPIHAEIVFLGTLDEIRAWEAEVAYTHHSLFEMEELTGIPIEVRYDFIHAVYDFYDKNHNVTRHLGAFMSIENFESLLVSDAKDFNVVFIGTHREVWVHLNYNVGEEEYAEVSDVEQDITLYDLDKEDLFQEVMRFHESRISGELYNLLPGDVHPDDLHHALLHFSNSGALLISLQNPEDSDFVTPTHIEFIFIGTLDEIYAWENENGGTSYAISVIESIANMRLEEEPLRFTPMRSWGIDDIYAVIDFYHEEHDIVRRIRHFAFAVDPIEVLPVESYKAVFIGTWRELASEYREDFRINITDWRLKYEEDLQEIIYNVIFGHDGVR